MMRDGVVVPSLSEEQCIEMMMSELNDEELHLAAADSFIKNGERLPLDDDTQDQNACAKRVNSGRNSVCAVR